MMNEYKLYGLASNPFREVSAEAIEDIRLLHVTQRMDSELAVIAREIAGGGRAVAAIVGELGSGKTERLRWLEEIAIQSGAFHIFLSVEPDFSLNMRRIFNNGLAQINARASIFGKLMPPRYVKETKKSLKNLAKKEAVELAILAAIMLKEQSPSFILLDNIDSGDEKFLVFLTSLVDQIKTGTMLCFSCKKRFFKSAKANYPSFADRINKLYFPSGLEDKEAELLVAKRLAVNRSVKNLDSLYPFTQQAVYSLNREVSGNPRALIKKLDDVISRASSTGAPLIAEEK